MVCANKKNKWKIQILKKFTIIVKDMGRSLVCRLLLWRYKENSIFVYQIIFNFCLDHQASLYFLVVFLVKYFKSTKWQQIFDFCQISAKAFNFLEFSQNYILQIRKLEKKIQKYFFPVIKIGKNTNAYKNQILVQISWRSISWWWIDLSKRNWKN